MKEDFTVPLINGEKIEKKLSKKYKEDGIDNDEEDNEFSNLINKKPKINKEIIYKNRIISKIFLIFFIQVSITYIFIYYSFKNQIFYKLIKENKKLFIASIGVTAIIFYSSYQFKEIFTTVPFNYFFFLVFTISISYLICKLLILFSFPTITVLWILLLIMILSLSVYAYNSKKDSKIIEIVIFVSLILISFGIIIKFVAKIPIMNMILMILCLISLSVYLIYDVKKTIEENKIGQKDYILVNVFLYTDIFRIFVKIVNLITEQVGKVLDKEDKSLLNEIKSVNEEIEKGFNEMKELGKNDDSDKKGKGKNKKGNKDEKGKKKDDKGKKGKKDDKKDKDKKDDKGKKGKKDKKKTQKKKSEDEEDDDDDNLFGDSGKIEKITGEFFSNLLSK